MMARLSLSAAVLLVAQKGHGLGAIPAGIGRAPEWASPANYTPRALDFDALQ